jgi:hypothetical protein
MYVVGTKFLESNIFIGFHNSIHIIQSSFSHEQEGTRFVTKKENIKLLKGTKTRTEGVFLTRWQWLGFDQYHQS